MTTPDHFTATFVVGLDRSDAWARLMDRPLDDDRVRLAGFDAVATVTKQIAEQELVATKDEEPCAGTEIHVTLEDAEAGTRITVVQSRFGPWLSDLYGVMAVGWRYIVADLHLYLETGAEGNRHLRPWPDFGATVTPAAGGLRISDLRSDTPAARLGLCDADLLVVLSGSPVSGHDDLQAVLRVHDTVGGEVSAEWIRSGLVKRGAVAWCAD